MSKKLDSRDGRVARRERTQARLLAATVELFAANGYAGTSIDEIAELAGVSKGSVFYNFGSKEDLFDAALRLCASRLSDAMLQAKGATRGAEALDRIVPALFTSISENRAATAVLMGELVRTGRPWSASVPALRRSVLSPLLDSLVEYVEELRDAGTINSDVPATQMEAMATMIWGSVVAVSLDVATPVVMSVTEHAKNMILHYLAAYRGNEDYPQILDNDYSRSAAYAQGEPELYLA